MTLTKKFSVVAALTQDGGIGYQNHLPWTKKLSIDMTFFRFLTTWPWTESEQDLDFRLGVPASNDESDSGSKNAVIMGRKTWDSVQFLGSPPFQNRTNVVLSRHADAYQQDALYLQRNNLSTSF
jgi:dihydrofolate reductase